MRKGAGHYRPDIDGLRALAIIPVVAFHTGLPGFSGGYVGVDVFFVISGFLITGLLLNEQEQDGRIALFDFYARRVRRLLPALTVTVLASLAMGAAWLSVTGDQQRLGRSAMATAGFASNIFFWRERGGYFGPQADTLPLLHTWTLAVEEQFYLLWPLGMMAAAMVSGWFGLGLRRALLAVLALGIVVSLALMVLMLFSGPGAAFYVTPCRGWELGLGALLAVRPRRAGNGRLATALAVVGVAAIVFAVVALDSHALLPVSAGVAGLGALAVLAAGAQSADNPVSRVLGSAPLRAVGKVSYGWYLWHWPLLAIARSHAFDRQLGRDVALTILALALASVSYLWIEKPVRGARVWPFRTTAGALAAGLVMVAAMAAAGLALLVQAEAKAAASPLSADIEAAQTTDFGALQACHHSPKIDFVLPSPERCSFGAKSAPVSVLLWGDSVSQQLVHPLDAAGKTQGVRVIGWTASGCRPHLRDGPDDDATRVARADCLRFSRAVLAALPRLRREQGLHAVVMAGAWTQPSGPADTGELAELATRIRAQGLKLVLVAETPHDARIAPNCLGYRSEAECAVPRAEAEHARAPIMATLQAVARTAPGSVRIVDALDAVCEGPSCPARTSGVIAYRDRVHLSRAGAMLLAKPLEPALAWAAAP